MSLAWLNVYCCEDAGEAQEDAPENYINAPIGEVLSITQACYFGIIGIAHFSKNPNLSHLQIPLMEFMSLLSLFNSTLPQLQSAWVVTKNQSSTNFSSDSPPLLLFLNTFVTVSTTELRRRVVIAFMFQMPIFPSDCFQLWSST